MTGHQFLMQFVMIFLGGMVFFAAGLILLYLERREKRR
jgi:hypothetical protein